MRAGLLRETIDIYNVKKTESSSGYMEPEYEHTHRVKAYRKKLSASVGTGIDAYEEFIANTLVFQVRKYPFMNDDMRIKYRSNFYKVILLDLQSDNTYLMTCSKLNGEYDRI